MTVLLMRRGDYTNNTEENDVKTEGECCHP